MYYIYIWYIKSSGEVFYVGRGHGNRYRTLKKRTKYFHEYYDKYECESRIILDNLSEEEAISEEQRFIFYNRSLGDAKANIHNGGRFGGDVVSHMSEKNRELFVKKMTKINKERCGSEDFRRRISDSTRKRYENPEERRKQSECMSRVWTKEKRAEQGEILRQYAKEHPELVQRRSEKHYKPCVLEFKGERMYFPSLKALKAYLLETYVFRVGSREKEQDMLKNHTPFTTTWKRRKTFEGLKMYYIV